MGNETKLILAMIFVLPLMGFGQICRSFVHRYPQPYNNWYLSTESYDPEPFSKMKTYFAPKDVKLVRLIMRNGKKNFDYVAFFKRNGVDIKVIQRDSFRSLPADTAQFTHSEKLVADELDSLYMKISRLASEGKSLDTLNKEMVLPKYETIRNKIWASKSILFMMHPIYVYKNYQLIMYRLVFDKSKASFQYAICSSSK